MELKLTAGGKETGASARGIRQPFVVYRLSFTIGPFFVTYKKGPLQVTSCSLKELALSQEIASSNFGSDCKRTDIRKLEGLV